MLLVMRMILAAMALHVGMVVSVSSGPWEDIRAAYKRGDFATALRLVRPLAEEGHASAQCELGMMYLDGKGVPQDSVTAVTWFRKAYNNGDVRCGVKLGLIYHHGLGVPQDVEAAFTSYQLAAEKGDALAQRLLGRMYSRGNVVPSDIVEAYKWFNLAVSRGDYTARFLRDTIAQAMTQDQINEAQRLAGEWKPKQ